MLKEGAEAGYRAKSFLVLYQIDQKPVESEKNEVAKKMQALCRANYTQKLYTKMSVYKNVKMAMTIASKFQYQAAETLN